MLKKAIVFFVLFLVFLTSSWSLFRSDFFYMHDFTHGARIVQMHKALSEGHFPVRWSSDLGYGYGMPLFQFYAPLPYYVGAFFYSLGFSLVNSIKVLFLISTLVVLLGSYSLGKTLFGRSGGMFLAAAITLAPYRAVNLFVRGAISEAWGIMALPFILYGIILVVKKVKNGWITLLFSLLVLILSHNLTALMFLPLSILFGAVYLLVATFGKKIGKLRTQFFIEKFAILAGTYLLAILISSFYLLPLIEKNYTRLDYAIVGNYFDYSLHFLYLRQFFQVNWKYGGSTWGPSDDISFYLGTGQLIALGLSGLFFVKHLFGVIFKKTKAFPKKITEIFDQKTILYSSSILLLGLSVFMSIYRSKFIWDKVEFLAFIQFPWRWLSAILIFLAISGGFLGRFVKREFYRNLFFGVIIVITIFSSWKFFQPEKYYSDSTGFYYEDRDKIRRDMSGILPDYIPVQMKNVVVDPAAQVDDLLGCEVDQRLVVINFPRNNRHEEYCDFEFAKLVDKTHQKLVEVDLPEDTLLEFAVADFPGWTAQVDGGFVKHEVSRFGTILVPVEAGKHKVGLEFKGSRLRDIADALSLFSLVIFLSIYFWYHGDLKHKKKANFDD